MVPVRRSKGNSSTLKTGTRSLFGFTSKADRDEAAARSPVELVAPAPSPRTFHTLEEGSSRPAWKGENDVRFCNSKYDWDGKYHGLIGIPTGKTLFVLTSYWPSKPASRDASSLKSCPRRPIALLKCLYQ